MARDGDGVGRVSTAGTDNANWLANAVTDAGGTTLISDNLILVVEGMEDAVSGALNPTAEGVVIAVVVVVAHLVARRLFGNCGTVDVDFDVGLKTSGRTCVGYFTSARASVDGLDWLVSAVIRVVDVVDLAVVLDLVLWVGAATVFTLSDVELSLDWGSASLVESKMSLANNVTQRLRRHLSFPRLRQSNPSKLTFRAKALSQDSDHAAHGDTPRKVESGKCKKKTGHDGSRRGRRRRLLPFRRLWDQGGLRHQYLPVRRAKHLSLR